MDYVFCSSYGAIFFAFHLKNSGRNIKLISDNFSIGKYCRAAAIDCIYFDYINVTTPTLYKMFALKEKIDSLIKEIGIQKDDNLYLLGNLYDISSFYLAKEWAKKGNVYFGLLGMGIGYNVYEEKGKLNLRRWIRTLSRYMYKMFLGLDLILLEVNKKPAYGIGDRFLQKNGIKNLCLEKNLTELQLEAIKKNPIKLKEYNNLIITEGDVSDVINEDSVTKIYRNLLELPCEFAIKHHPQVVRNSESYGFKQIPTNLEELPDYIPVELLLNNIRKNVVSVYSGSLIPASKLEHLRAISMLELVQWVDESFKSEVKEWLMKESNGRIIFVTTFDELSKLLES